MPIGWKVLNHDGTPCHGGTGKWDLPTKNPDGSWTPGKWMVEKGPLYLCEEGTLHLCKSTRHLLEWLGPAVFHVEYRGEVAEADDKVGVLEARLLAKNEHWNEQTARLFAADCAEGVVHLANNERSTHAILTARRFAFGLVDEEELDAAMAAALDAASGATARAAARAAAMAAARDAAKASAWAAAWDAARDAAWDAARDTQTKRLHAYLTGQVDLEAIRKSLL